MTKFTREHSAAALCANGGKDTDLQVGVVSRSVHVQVCRAEGGGGERQDHGANTPHGQQGSAEGCPHWTQSLQARRGAYHTVRHGNTGSALELTDSDFRLHDSLDYDCRAEHVFI